MFTGIIETIGRIEQINAQGTNVDFAVKSSFTSELKVDQSVSHNGVCLTVTKIDGDVYYVSAIDETLKKSNLGDLKIGSKVNLERGIKVGDRLDGHIVQGHVDTTGKCIGKTTEDGSWIFTFQYETNPEHLTIPKGSITVNGVSLTVVNSGINDFSVAIIPFTYEHTTFQNLEPGDTVNLEFDVIGKYVAKIQANKG